MKVVIALGFYDDVLVYLQKEHSALLLSHSILWVGTIGPHGDGDLVNFRALLFDRLALGVMNILVLACIRRGREGDYGGRVVEIINWAKDRHPDTYIQITTFSYASASSEVDRRICNFLDISTQDEEAFPR